MINITTPVVNFHVTVSYNESSPGTLDRLGTLEKNMSAETDKVAEVDAKADQLVTSVKAVVSTLDSIKVELEGLKAVAGNDPEVIAGLDRISGKLSGATDDLTAATNPPTP